MLTEEQFNRLSVPMKLLVTPFLGLAFVMFLPAAGFYLVGQHLIRASVALFTSVSRLLHSH